MTATFMDYYAFPLVIVIGLALLVFIQGSEE